MTLTVTDLFCGAGGSSSGAEAVPGVRVRMATNHWGLAIETHNTNLPHVDHDIANVAEADPHRYPETDILWCSPECTNWSVARGQKQDFAAPDDPALFDDDGRPLPDEAVVRSRALMEDVPRFADVHRYKAVIVENVPDILNWTDIGHWYARMRGLGYRHRTVVLNSAFCHQLGAPAPQLRDRFYAVFVQDRYPMPDLDAWTRPQGWCPTCGAVVTAMHAPKNPRRPVGRYWSQYVFRCPAVSCRNEVVHPYVLPAAAAIDWAVPGERIGDRAKPLAAKTMARIEAGLRRYARQPWVETMRSGRPRARSVADPLATVVADGSAHYLVDDASRAAPPFLTIHRGGPDEIRTRPLHHPAPSFTASGNHHALVVPVEGRDGKQARPADLPLRGQTTRNETGLLVPAGGTWNDAAQPTDDRPMRARTTRETEGVVVVPLRSTNRTKDVGQPLDTVAANGNHHALLMRHNNVRGDEGYLSTPVGEPARTITSAGHQSLLQWNPNLMLAYDSGAVRATRTEPLPTQTTVEGDAVLQSGVDVMDCLFRMLMPDEIKVAMAFTPGFVLLGNKREKVKLAGNAVTPPAARDLIAAVVEAITGDDVRAAA